MEQVNTCDGSLALRTVLLVDDTDEISLSVFGEKGGELVEQSVYEISFLSINCFNSERILKSSERTAFKEVEASFTTIVKPSTTRTVTGKVTSVNSKDFATKRSCQECRASISEQDIDDGMVICPACGQMCTDDGLIDNSIVDFTLTCEQGTKLQLRAALTDMVKKYNVQPDNKIELAKAMMRNHCQYKLL